MRTREYWVDYTKVVACLLVLLGHLLQGVVADGVMQVNPLYLWFNDTVYLFHVPLFFICSGYLFQKYSKVDSLASWKNGILKKLLVLGVPYVSFTVATWLIKVIFSGAGTNSIDNIFVTVFLAPTSPYWFLYALFFVFLVTPTAKTKKWLYSMLCVSFLVRVFYELGLFSSITAVRAISYVLAYEVWFVLGMLLSYVLENRCVRNRILSLSLAIVFFIGSAFRYLSDIAVPLFAFALGVIMCAAIILFFVCNESSGKKQNRCLCFLAKYTMPIFLMHSIFVATLRTILLKVGVVNLFVHVALELTIGILGPIVAAYIIEKSLYLDFFLYPDKMIKRIRERKRICQVKS